MSPEALKEALIELVKSGDLKLEVELDSGDLYEGTPGYIGVKVCMSIGGRRWLMAEDNIHIQLKRYED